MEILIIPVLIIILFLANIFFTNHLTISKYTYKSDKFLVKDDFKIVQISDLHNKEFGKNNNRLINKIKTLSPDIIVITGDLVNSISQNDTQSASINLVKKLSTIAPLFFVTGNHEYMGDPDYLYAFENDLEKNGANVLQNEYIDFNNNIRIIGLDDSCLDENNAYLEDNLKLSNLIKDDTINIVLAHEPQYLTLYSEANADIVLSGHTHGGQITIPLINQGIYAPNQGFFPKYTYGKYQLNNTTLFLNRGLGTTFLPIRFFNCPEITEITISCQ